MGMAIRARRSTSPRPLLIAECESGMARMSELAGGVWLRMAHPAHKSSSAFEKRRRTFQLSWDGYSAAVAAAAAGGPMIALAFATSRQPAIHKHEQILIIVSGKV